MAMQVEILSKETIKPSSPTPQNLRKYTLSFLDQIAPEMFMPLIYYYSAEDVTKNNTSLDTRTKHLKTSLSQVLTLFYPLAGRFSDNLYVDCNDEGALFVEARVNSQLSDVLRHPIPNELNKLLAFELDHVMDVNLAVQVNYFKCGGMAIAIAISHKIVDAMSFLTFVNIWAAIARGERNVPSPILESSAIFPPIDVSGFRASIGIVKENVTCKRFVFNASKIAALRNKYTLDNSNTGTGSSNRPSRVEALSAFIWNRFMAATQDLRKESGKIFTILYAVNLRSKFDPPLPDNYFGNLFRVATFVPSMAGQGTSNGTLIKMAREAIQSIDSNYVQELRKGENHLKLVKQMCESFAKGEVQSFSYTSLCRSPLYEADFSWGRPVWLGSVRLIFEYLVTFFDTKTGDGIEAWINLKEEEMVKFEADQELLEFVEK